MKIAFIGIGVMGKGMVMNLRKAGHTLSVYNRTYSKAKAIEADGITAYTTIKECCKDADIIMTMVGFPKDVEEVYYMKDGIFDSAKKNTILIDYTTSSPTLAKKLYEDAKKHHLYMLDAPVSGGDIGAQNGSLSIMCGGDKEIYDKVLPIFECIGTTFNYMGEAGNGQHTKMCNQICVAGAVAAVAEALAYANHAGISSEDMLKAISKGAAGSWQLDHNALKMVHHDFNPGFYNKHFVKDMTIAQNEAEQNGLSLELLSTVLKIYKTLCDEGYEDLGTQSVIKYYDD